MVQVLYTGDATAHGRRGEATSSDGRLNVQLSEPKAFGGDNGPGTNPEQMFAAAHAACFAGAVEWQARQRGVKLNGITVHAEVGVGPGDSGAFGLTETLTVTLPGLDQAVADELVGLADKGCPYSNAVRGNVEVQLIVKTS